MPSINYNHLKIIGLTKIKTPTILLGQEERNVNTKAFDNGILESLPVDYDIDDYWTLLKKATSFRINDDVSLEYRGKHLWAVSTGMKFVLNKEGKSEYEPMPSHRSEEFITNTRFDFTDAMDSAYAFIEKRRQEYSDAVVRKEQLKKEAETNE